jgi:glycosyltransferase involved in cell wall biosynthesis
LSTLAEREITVGAIATSEGGVAQYLSPARVVVEPTSGQRPITIGKIGGIERPAYGGCVHRGRVRVSGWALAEGASLGHVQVRVNGRDAGLARPFAAARPDVASRYDEPGAPLAGFEHIISVDGRPGEQVRIDADLVTIDGRHHALSGTRVGIAARPVREPDRSPSDVLGALGPIQATNIGGPLRVVAFTHDLRVGGAQLYLQELLRDLLKTSDVTCLVVTNGGGPLCEELDLLGAAVHVTDYPSPESANYEARCVELATLTRAFGATVVIVNTLIAAIGADVACRLDLPAVWAIHESYTLEDYWAIAGGDGMAPALAANNQATLAETAVVLFEADATRAVYGQLVDSDRLATLYYGIDVEKIDEFCSSVDRAQVREEAGLHRDAIVLASVGVFEPRKAQAMLATAFACIVDEFPSARLVLVGDTDTTYARGVRQLVDGLGLGERIRLEAIDPEPYRWYAAADGFVMASDLESMPRVLLEAMAFGLPVVATNVWGIPELVRPGENGLLFPPRDVEALAAALRDFLRLSPAVRECLGESGSRLVRARHDLADYRRVFERLLRRLAVDPQQSVSTLLGP